eukprot:SAG11_NODE_210_length_12303_cov_10.235824_5_plen_231_part_00
MASRAIAPSGTGPELAAFNFILSLDAMAEMAATIGDASNHSHYRQLGTSMRTAFHTAFWNTTMQRFGSGQNASSVLLLQSLNVAPLALGLEGLNGAPSQENLAAIVHDDIVSRHDHLTVGSVGGKYLLPQLSANGLHDDAVAVATQRTFPSFGYWLSQGATTCWEDYSGWPSPSHPTTPTRNHVSHELLVTLLCMSGSVFCHNIDVIELYSTWCQIDCLSFATNCMRRWF